MLRSQALMSPQAASGEAQPEAGNASAGKNLSYLMQRRRGRLLWDAVDRAPRPRRNGKMDSRIRGASLLSCRLGNRRFGTRQGSICPGTDKTRFPLGRFSGPYCCALMVKTTVTRAK